MLSFSGNVRKITKRFFYFFRRVKTNSTPPRSQALSPLPPFVVGRKTLFAASLQSIDRFSDSRYWTGTSLQLRLRRGNIIKKTLMSFAFEKDFPH